MVFSKGEEKRAKVSAMFAMLGPARSGPKQKDQGVQSHPCLYSLLKTKGGAVNEQNPYKIIVGSGRRYGDRPGHQALVLF